MTADEMELRDVEIYRERKNGTPLKVIAEKWGISVSRVAHIAGPLKDWRDQEG